ncbi:hypothetical protein CDIK_0401 [Cucumispora dikerogammari]|nr:hypothetical protein CDIK_0401 [Cucumispora dikerogammari]
MHNTFRAFKYSTTNKSVNNKTKSDINSQNSVSNDIVWYHFFAEKNRTIQIILTKNLEVKLEIETIDCTSMYLIDYIDFREISNFSTNKNENVVYVSFLLKIEKKFQITFYSDSEAVIFNEMINKIIFGVENKYNHFTTQMFELAGCSKELELRRCKSYIQKRIKNKILKFIEEMKQINNDCGDT